MTADGNYKVNSKHVALVIPMKSGYYDDMLRGIVSYVRLHPHWYVRYVTGYDAAKAFVDVGKPDGILGAIDAFKLAPAFTRGRSPIVNVSYINASVPFPRVGVDERQVGKLAAEHLIERGFRRFAFVGQTGSAYSDERMEHYRAALREAGLPCEVFDNAKPYTSGSTVEDRLADWVLSLPKPVAVFACNDDLALVVSEVCHHVGVRIPDDLALLGVDDAELICELASPPLSSIATVPQRIGFEAAALLDRLMQGRKPPKGPILLPPAYVATRQSTDVVAVDDVGVAQAIRFIRDNAHQPIGVPDVLNEVLVSRRMLERRFHEVLGRSPKQEIRRIKIAKAKGLLARTDLPMYTVASQCGFPNSRRFCIAFRQETGQSPSEFRSQTAGGPAA